MNHIRPVFLKLAFTVSMLLLASIAVTPAKANLVTFDFTGAVDTIGSNIVGAPSDGSLFKGNSLPSNSVQTSISLSGSYTFDPLTLNSSGFAPIGMYNNSISSLNFTLSPAPGSLVTSIYNYTSGGILHPIAPNFIVVQNNLLGQDVYQVQTPFSGAAVGPIGSVRPASTFSIDYGNTVLTTFSDTLLPTTPPSLNVGSFGQFKIIFDGGDGSVITGRITNLVASPLPPAVILFGAGLVALVGLGAGSWRQRKNGLA